MQTHIDGTKPWRLAQGHVMVKVRCFPEGRGGLNPDEHLNPSVLTTLQSCFGPLSVFDLNTSSFVSSETSALWAFYCFSLLPQMFYIKWNTTLLLSFWVLVPNTVPIFIPITNPAFQWMWRLHALNDLYSNELCVSLDATFNTPCSPTFTSLLYTVDLIQLFVCFVWFIPHCREKSSSVTLMLWLCVTIYK